MKRLQLWLILLCLLWSTGTYGQSVPSGGGGGVGGTGCTSSGSSILKGNGAGGCGNATAGVDYIAPGAFDAEDITVNSATLVGTGTDVQAVFEELDNAVVAAQSTADTHIANATAAHAATAISVNSTNLDGTSVTVQGSLEEIETQLDSHISDASAAHAASAISFSATGAIAATDVQAAIAEVDSEKLPLAGGTMTGQLVLDNLGISAPASDTNPSCAGGGYVLYTDLSETKWKLCENGVLTSVANPPATAVAVTPFSTIAATTVQAALEEIVAEATSGTDDQTAAEVPFTPAGNIAATNVQTALEELDTEKLSSESDTLDSAFGRGKVIGGANSSANAMQVCDDDVPTNCWRIYVSSGDFIIDTNPASNARQRIATNTTGGFYDVEGAADILVIDPDAASVNAMYQFGAAYRPRKSIWFGADSLYGDGTQCPSAPTAVTINSGPILSTFICTDNDASSLYGSVKMPDAWDGGTVTFTHVYIQTAADTSALNGDIACQARSNGEAPSSTWGTEVALDDAAVVGSNSNDMIVSAAATCAGTGVAGGDMLYFRYQLDATGTTTAVATLHHVGFMLEYTVSSLSD